MKKLVIIMLLFSCLIPGTVTARDYPVLDNQVETRQAHLEWTLTIQEISMDAVVEYIDEISDGERTTDLMRLLEEFKAQVDDVESYTTHIGLNNYIRELREITTEFRKEARIQLGEYNGRAMVLLVRIGEKIDENRDLLDELKDNYWLTRKENVLENFDIRVMRAQNILEKLEERGYDVSEAEEKLEEINALRDELEAAHDEMDNRKILEVSIEALELSRELAGIVRDLQLKIPPKRILQHWVNVGKRVVERTGIIIDELERLGLDTEELEAIHGEAESHLDEAITKFEEDDFEGTAEALRKLKDDLIELRDAYIELVFPEGYPDELDDAMDTLGGKLEEVSENMNTGLENL